MQYNFVVYNVLWSTDCGKYYLVYVLHYMYAFSCVDSVLHYSIVHVAWIMELSRSDTQHVGCFDYTMAGHCACSFHAEKQLGVIMPTHQ
jgi:hypothetical protein